MVSKAPINPEYVPPPSRPARVTKPPPWGWLITADLMFSELSSGLFVVAALSDLIAHDVYGPLARIGYLMAFPLIVADLFCLVADLGDPLRFHHMLRVFKGRSPMSTGVWVISLFALISFVCFILAAVAPWLTLPMLILAAIGIAPALFVGGYKGVLFSSTAQAFWKDSRWLGAELVTSAAMLGAAGLLLTALFVPVAQAVDGIRRTEIALLLINLVLSAPMFVHLGSGQHQLGAIGFLRYATMVAVEWIAPLVLCFVGGTEELAAAACLVLLGALLFRRDLVTLPYQAASSGLPLESVGIDRRATGRAG